MQCDVFPSNSTLLVSDASFCTFLIDGDPLLVFWRRLGAHFVLCAKGYNISNNVSGKCKNADKAATDVIGGATTPELSAPELAPIWCSGSGPDF